MFVPNPYQVLFSFHQALNDSSHLLEYLKAKQGQIFPYDQRSLQQNREGKLKARSIIHGGTDFKDLDSTLYLPL